MKPAACSSASGEPVKPDLAKRAASTPACAVRPTCSGFVIVPKLATTPAASEVAMAMAFRVSSTVSRLGHDRLAGAGNHDVDAVDHVDARAIAAPLRNGACFNRCHELGNVRH